MTVSPDLLTTADVASLLRVHPKQVYRLLRQGLPGRRLGSEWRFVADEVLAWVAGRSVSDPRGPLQAPAHSPAHAPGVEPGTPADPPPLVAANGDPVIEILLSALNVPGRPPVGFVRADRIRGIELLEHGEVAAAGCHGAEPPRRLPAGRLARLHLVEREVGLVRRGTIDMARPPKLLPARFAARPATAGLHVHLVAWLNTIGIDAESFLAGAPTHESHQSVVEAVVRGEADAGFTTAAWAARLGLPFIATATESYGLMVQAQHLGRPLIMALCETAQSVAVIRAIAAVPGYDAAGCGRIVYDPEPAAV